MSIRNGTVTLAGRNLRAAWTIPTNASLSTSYVDLGGKALVAMVIPAGYDGGNITFQASDTAGGAYFDVYDAAGSVVTVTVTGAPQVVAITGVALQALASLQFVKIQCSALVAAARIITTIAKG